MRECRDEPPQSLQASRLVGFAEVDGAADRGVHARAPEVLVADGLADGRFHQGGTGQVQAAALGHEQLVAQHRQVAAAGDAVAEDGRELGHALGRQHGVVAEDAPEVVLVGEDLVLQGQEDAGAVDEVDEGQAVLAGDALGAEDLLAGHGEEGAGLDGGVVGDDHDAAPGDGADAGDDAGGGRPAPLLVHPPGRPQAQLEEGRAGVEQDGEALADGEPAFVVLPGRRPGASPLRQHTLFPADVLDQLRQVAAHGSVSRGPSAGEDALFMCLSYGGTSC